MAWNGFHVFHRLLGFSVTALEIVIINFPIAIDQWQQRENHAYPGNDKKTQDKIDDTEDERTFDGIWNRDHNWIEIKMILIRDQAMVTKPFKDLTGNYINGLIAFKASYSTDEDKPKSTDGSQIRGIAL
jgi:hypothetical protein